MNGREEGFLLLTSKLGNPERKCLTVAQFRQLAQRAGTLKIDDPDRELSENDLLALGYNREMAARIVSLLADRELLKHYAHKGVRHGCLVLTRVSDGYPQTLHKRLGLDAPGCLWMKGDFEALEAPAVSLVGSRELREDNRAFAREAGRQAALQGYTLISGNARGADREAQDSCLEHGGKVISVLADTLFDKEARKDILYLSEDGYDLPFSAQRAHSRNRVIHAMPTLGVFVAQCSMDTGGTWHGTQKNLKHNYTDVFCYGDGSPAQRALCDLGAEAITLAELSDFYGLQNKSGSLF